MASGDKTPFLLAKLMVAFGWADGSLDDDEVVAMKNALFQIGELSASQWMELEAFMENPVDEETRKALIQELGENLTTPHEIDGAIKALQEVIEADGNISPEEAAALQSAKESLQGGALGSLGTLARGFIKRGLASLAGFREREGGGSEFSHNRILEDIKRSSDARASHLQALSQRDLEKCTAAAALLGRVALADGDFSEEERGRAVDILGQTQNLEKSAASLVVDIARRRVEALRESGVGDDIDYYHYTLIFFERSDYPERVNFLKALFQIANASEKTSFEEIEQIRSISIDLKVDHNDFIQAKLTIPKGDRKGL